MVGGCLLGSHSGGGQLDTSPGVWSLPSFFQGPRAIQAPTGTPRPPPPLLIEFAGSERQDPAAAGIPKQTLPPTDRKRGLRWAAAARLPPTRACLPGLPALLDDVTADLLEEVWRGAELPGKADFECLQRARGIPPPTPRIGGEFGAGFFF